MNHPLIKKFVDIAETCNRLGIDTSLEVRYITTDGKGLIVRHSMTPLWNIFEFYTFSGVEPDPSSKQFSVRCAGQNIAVDRYTDDEKLVRHMLLCAGGHYAHKIEEQAILLKTALRETFAESEALALPA